MLKLVSFLCLFITCISASAQSPRNLTANIAWSTRTATVAAIQTAYNAARRAEETQLSLTPNILGNLTLPADFLTRTSGIQGLMLINAERACRGGVNYGDGACKGWIFEGIESNVALVAQNYANLCISSNCWGHYCGAVPDPFVRISNGVGASCLEFINRGENLAVYATSGATNAMPVVQSVFDWIYNDASSSWGHREACFLQDRSLDGNVANGFADNHGAAGAEGFLGIGTAGGNAYSAPFGTAYNRADLVVLDFFDPVASACTFSVLDVNLLSFNALYKNNKTFLTWQTASEKSNLGFTIERSTDGYNFDAIGFVKGNNNSTTIKNYDFTDATPLSNSVNYYRLAWENQSGKIENSKIIAVQMSEKMSLLAYPNPMENVLTVKLPNYNSGSILALINAQGQVILNVENNAQIDVSNLAKGIYFLRATFGNETITEKLIKL